MKIGIVSDLHLEFIKDRTDWSILAKTINRTEADLVVNAGDINPKISERKFFRDLIKLNNYEDILGNHDFYGQQYPFTKRFVRWAGGLKVAGTTLWVNFDNMDPLTVFKFPHILADGRQIIKHENFTTLADELNEMFVDDLKFIEDQKPDIVVTHHAPSEKSVHQKFKGGGFTNYYFMSDLDQFILDNQNIKLWIHGHMHDPCDYMIEKTRIVSNPLGYPGETYRNVLDYKPLIIEV